MRYIPVPLCPFCVISYTFPFTEPVLNSMMILPQCFIAPAVLIMMLARTLVFVPFLNTDHLQHLLNSGIIYCQKKTSSLLLFLLTAHHSNYLQVSHYLQYEIHISKHLKSRATNSFTNSLFQISSLPSPCQTGIPSSRLKPPKKPTTGSYDQRPVQWENACSPNPA